MNDTVAFALQIVIGIVIVLGVYRMSLWLLREDQLVANARRKRKDNMEIKVVDGWAMSSLAQNRSWNTVNPSGLNYAPIMRSYNRKGGAQFSYSFWLSLEDTSPQNVAGRDIIIRGDNRVYTYARTVTRQDSVLPSATERITVSDLVVKCPRIRFGDSFDTIIVELNTLHNPDEKIVIAPNAAQSGDPTLRHNMLKLSQNKWALYTFTFEDNVAITDFEDGILVRFYMNDVQYHTARIRSTLRQNIGNLYLMPTREGEEPIKNARIGDLIYYNFALGPQQVQEIFARGPPRYMAKDIMRNNSMLGDPLHLSEYNRLDIYNT